ncbi:MAG: VWA domain-containing protein [Myxococcota bacterium]|nr:BatB protein [Deltaproteobacteria bacterium]MCP4243094.1 VWA domain-containing protein [bacterium]MDP6076502.1 VWA domain-containing protein [Myxococcota bacterium]MDP6242208.1 VWA domain-containing protein [Myxococcota bacterium]MDP7075682.1 VWA domain-containing protein [Myxococcota bacterium]
MIDFALPWLLLLLPLPLLVWWLFPPAPEGSGGALRVPFFASLRALPAGGAGGSGSGRAALVLKVAAWSLLVVAAAQPRWMGEPRSVSTHGRDLMIALDLSGSMATEDFDVSGHSVDRLRVVNAVAREFVNHREGDRIGLVLFGTRAYLQAPLTFDRQTVIEMLDEAEIGLPGEETAIGDAIGLAVKHLRNRPAEERVLVLLSDGASNTGVLEPVQAAELAAREGVRIYTIGIGSGRQVVQTLMGPRVMNTDAELDEAALQKVADLTGGAYFRARDTQGLVEVYRRIDALEPTEGEAAQVRPTRALFHYPLAAALALAALLLLWRFARETDLSLRPERFAAPEEEMAR